MSEKYTDDIIKIEFDLFDKVHNAGGRASCQDDFDTFSRQRGAQFDAWSEETRASYLDDLKKTSAEGRNLVMEKYAYMSGYDYMGEEDDIIEKQMLLMQIMQQMNEETYAMRQKYPNISMRARPYGDEPGSMVSVDSYLLCELLTYSCETLRRYKRHLDNLKEQGLSLPVLTMENTMHAYGYASLEDAEAKLA